MSTEKDMIGPNAKEAIERHALKIEAREAWHCLGGDTGESPHDPYDFIAGYIKGVLAERSRQETRYREALDMITGQAQTIKGFMDVVDEMLGKKD